MILRGALKMLSLFCAVSALPAIKKYTEVFHGFVLVFINMCNNDWLYNLHVKRPDIILAEISIIRGSDWLYLGLLLFFVF